VLTTLDDMLSHYRSDETGTVFQSEVQFIFNRVIIDINLIQTNSAPARQSLDNDAPTAHHLQDLQV
jgi:hypothetical protein